MELNADFSRRAAMHGAGMDWVASPMPGVERRMLDRIGGEVARARHPSSATRRTAISLPMSITGGEEFLVLEGVFQDEHGDFPPGSYVRNPPQSRHTPGSSQGLRDLRETLAIRPRRPGSGDPWHHRGNARPSARSSRRLADPVTRGRAGECPAGSLVT